MSDIAAIFGVFITLLSLLLTTMYTHRHDRRNKAFELMGRWNSPQIQDIRQQALAAIQRGHLTDNERYLILTYLNVLEELAIAVLNNEADEDLCKKFFLRSLLHDYYFFEEAFKNNPREYSSIHRLYLQWR